MLVVMCSDKGSPGSTSTALALASGWGGPALVVEADPAGGDLAIRLRTSRGDALPEAPTVLTVASAASREAAAAAAGDVFVRHAHSFTSSVSVIPGHLHAEQASAGVDWPALASLAARAEDVVVVDVGRLDGSSPLLVMAAAADVVVVVGRPDPGSVIRIRERLSRLVPLLSRREAQHRVRLFPVLVSRSRHAAADTRDLSRLVADSSAGPFVVGVGYVAWDTAALQRLERGEDPHGRLARTPLMRSASDLATEVALAAGRRVRAAPITARSTTEAGRR